MSANRIYLVCQKHQSAEHVFCIGERADGDSQYTAPSNKRMDDWYAKHQGCARGADHFTVAYRRSRDWDLSPEAQDTVAGAVRLELVKGGLK